MTRYAEYVDNYSDLSSAFRASQNWEQYVNDYSDLSSAWNALPADQKASYESNKGSFPTGRALWGAEHYTKFGSKEGRDVPLTAPDGSIVYNKDDWGLAHWNSFGSNEDRILSGAKFSLSRDGTLTVEPGTIGSKALPGYEKIASQFNNTPGDNYKELMEGLSSSLNALELNDLLANKGIDVLSASYQAHIDPWDATTGAQPPTGGFDATYYRTQTEGGKEALGEWNAALKGVNVAGILIPDLDITGRYTTDSYMQWHYTTQGKAAGYRGNAATEAGLTTGYEEYLTDAEYQLYRDQVLGIGDQSLLGASVNTELLGKEKQLQQQFGSLTADSLKAAGDELLQQKAKERDYEFYSGLPGFDEVFSINESIANSLIADTGIGGILGFVANPYEFKENLEKGVSSITGLPNFNSVSYNWEQWFEKELLSKYEDGITVTDPYDPTKTYVIESEEFAKKYIDEYLKPRFDNSRSMSEFMSTLELEQYNEKVFQTATAMQQLKDIADLRAKAYLDGVKSKDPLNFSADFYWNPTGNFTEDDPKVLKYQEQTAEVAKDWETAKNNGSSLVPGTEWTWDQWAYHYGLDIKDKNQFAQLHYQIVGAAKGFDPAQDVITLKDAQDYITQTIIPEIASTDADLADIMFLQYVTPEEFAQGVVEGISPETNKEEWDNMLKTLGITDEDLGVQGIEEYIADQFRVGNAETIRQSLQYLNEKNIKPTQELLGIDYIQREEDYQPTSSPYETSLYKLFKDAGYQGNEDDFYGSFMTDVSKEEMQLLEQGASEKGLQLGAGYYNLTSDDPFQALASLTSLLDEDTEDTEEDEKEDGSTDYFRLVGEEESMAYKSDTAESILGSFTSLFKGFS